MLLTVWLLPMDSKLLLLTVVKSEGRSPGLCDGSMGQDSLYTESLSAYASDSQHAYSSPAQQYYR